MITYLRSNLFFSPAQVLVNTVNTEGVMGKGIAKDFKDYFPDMFLQYQRYCEEKKLIVGNLWLYKTSNKWILNFPTKESWRKPSKLEYIEKGLQKFVSTYEDRGIKSIAFPPLGCGNGGLNWEKDVQPLMEFHLKKLPIDVYIHLYAQDSLVDVPEHRHIPNVSKWLQSEPQFLSLSEVLENLKSIAGLSCPDSWKSFEMSFSDSGDISIKSSEQTITWENSYLLELWSIFRKHGLVSLENIPSVFADNYDLFLKVFSILPYISITEAATKASDLKNFEKHFALQFLPYEKESYDKKVAI